MLMLVGALLLVLGVLCGGVLTASGLGLTDVQPGWTGALGFPAFVAAGLGACASSLEERWSRLAMRAAGTICLLLAMAAVSLLVLRGLWLITRPMDIPTLLWVFLCGFSLAGLGVVGARRPRST